MERGVTYLLAWLLVRQKGVLDYGCAIGKAKMLVTFPICTYVQSVSLYCIYFFLPILSRKQFLFTPILRKLYDSLAPGLCKAWFFLVGPLSNFEIGL